MRIGLLVCLISLSAPLAWAVDDVEVVGLFKGKAVLRIDGARHVLGEGETSPEGVTLISADSERAVLEVDGERRTHNLSRGVTTRYKSPEQTSVRLHRGRRGMFGTVGAINGLTVDFLVDTGASAVAMNAGQARRLGIDFRVEGTPGRVETASGFAQAYQVTLDTVRVGEIELRNVQAVVIDGPQPRKVLLGMTFLSRLEIENKGSVMILRQSH